MNADIERLRKAFQEVANTVKEIADELVQRLKSLLKYKKNNANRKLPTPPMVISMKSQVFIFKPLLLRIRNSC